MVLIGRCGLDRNEWKSLKNLMVRSTVVTMQEYLPQLNAVGIESMGQGEVRPCISPLNDFLHHKKKNTVHIQCYNEDRVTSYSTILVVK